MDPREAFPGRALAPRPGLHRVLSVQEKGHGDKHPMSGGVEYRPWVFTTPLDVELKPLRGREAACGFG